MTQSELKAAIVQDAATGRVLMLAWMDEEALRRTRESGEAWFWSRSRQEYWHKGATSGSTLAVEELREDCDGDAILLRVHPNGPACHTGAESCFAPWLWRRVAERAQERPEGSYVARLLADGPKRRGPEAGGGGGRGGARRRRRVGRAARLRARRPLVPQLRAARRPRPRPGGGRGRAPPAQPVGRQLSLSRGGSSAAAPISASAATTASTGSVASSSCVHVARSSGSTSARWRRIAARSSATLP